MRTPRTLVLAFAAAMTCAFTPALASEAETVEIQIDLDASATDIYQSIREQAWAACKPEKLSSFVMARMSVRRDCQKAMVADVVQELSNPEVMTLAQKDGIRAES